jgi:TonB family protein
MQRSAALLAFLLGLRPPPGSAQDSLRDSTITRLAWGTVNVLVQADTTNGLLVWAETSPIAYQETQQSFAASFNPQAMDPWLNLAHLIVTTTTPPSDSATALATPPLVARDGSHLVVFRRWKKHKWESHAAILLLDREERHPWYIDADRDNARKFLEALWLQAGRSRQRPASTAMHDANPLDPGSCPQPLPGTLVLRYPEVLRQRWESGEVWMSFVVQPDGTPDTASFQVLLSDDRTFATAVIEALRRARYRPAEVGGVPIAAHVHQRFVFRIR